MKKKSKIYIKIIRNLQYFCLKYRYIPYLKKYRNANMERYTDYYFRGHSKEITELNIAANEAFIAANDAVKYIKDDKSSLFAKLALKSFKVKLYRIQALEANLYLKIEEEKES